MELWEVIGVDTNAVITIKQEGKTIRGVKFFLVGDAPAGEGSRYRGRICREQFISHDRLGRIGVEPLPGDLIELYFNRYGDIENIKRAGAVEPAKPYGSA